MKSATNRENEVRQIAHRIWLEEGQPNGDVLVQSFGRTIPLKQVHWKWAELEWTYGPEYLK